MVLDVATCVVSSEGHIMPPRFSLSELRVSADAHVETFQAAVRQALAGSCTRKNLWHPNSPDLSLLHYCMWVPLKKKLISFTTTLNPFW